MMKNFFDRKNQVSILVTALATNLFWVLVAANNQPEQNVVLRFSTIENSLLALDEIKKFGNLSLRKAAFDSESSSLHLYLTILK